IQGNQLEIERIRRLNQGPAVARRLIQFSRFSLWIFFLLIGIMLLSWSTVPTSVFAAEIEGPEVAQELFRTNVITVNTPHDLLNQMDGLCSLREAVISANTNPNHLLLAGECANGSPTVPDEIVLEGGVTYQLSILGSDWPESTADRDLDIYNNRAELDIVFSTTGEGLAIIRGIGLDEHIPTTWIDLTHYSLFDVHGATVTFDHVELRNGINYRDAGAGLVNVLGDVTFTNSRIVNNRSVAGGGLANFNGVMRLINSEVTLNGNYFVENIRIEDGHMLGGGIYNGGEDAQLILEDTLVSENLLASGTVMSASQGYGSAIYNENGGSVTFLPGSAGNQILNNMSIGGGAIWNDDGLIEGEAVNVIGNTAEYDNAGITNVNGGIINLNDGVIGLHGQGIGVHNDASALSLSSFLFSLNEVTGLLNEGGTVNLEQVTIEHSNSSGLESFGGEIVIDQSVIRNNEASNGGGLRLLNGANVFITRSSIVNNEAMAGGGIFLFNSSLEMVNSTLGDNTTWLGVAGGILIQGNSVSDTARFINVTAENNSAASGSGSALFLLSQTIAVETRHSIWSGPLGETVCSSNIGSNPLTSLGHNLSSDSTCFETAAPTDLEGVNPQLDSLTEVDGTSLYPLLPGSPAIDMIAKKICFIDPINGIDQRGAQRDPLCDIGAYEFAP
ncbi:MAG: right-handed parallel beta-helix repeat-containing protein, partial [Chloroflexota bacterium]